MAKNNTASRRQPNFILEAGVGTWPEGKLPDNMNRTKKQVTDDYAALARRLTGSDIMPAVFYKGRLIPAGKLGSRAIAA